MRENFFQDMISHSIISFISICFMIQPVSAHGSVRTTSLGINVLSVITIVAGISATIGFITVSLRNQIESPIESVYTHKLVGVLFVGIGLTAASSVMLKHLFAGLIAGGIGILIGTVIATQHSCSARPKTAISSITIHRFIEGSALAALSIAGQTVSTLGIIALTIHAVVECISIGIYPEITWIQAIGSISIVTFSFAFGFGVGMLGLTAIEIVLTDLVISTIGGLLFALGISELRPRLVGQIQQYSRPFIKEL